MLDTQNDLDKGTREKVVEILAARLNDAIDLMLQTKHAHWNVKGPDFFQLHELFDKINEDVEDYVDDIAERAVELGAFVDGDARTVAKESALGAYPRGLRDGMAHCKALSAALARFGKLARAAIEQTAKLGDAATSDLFTEIVRGNDKWLWMVEAHLQAER